MSPNVNTQRSFDCFLTQRFCFPPLSLSSQSKRFFYLSRKNQGNEEECLFLSYTLSEDTQTRWNPACLNPFRFTSACVSSHTQIPQHTSPNSWGMLGIYSKNLWFCVGQQLSPLCRAWGSLTTTLKGPLAHNGASPDKVSTWGERKRDGGRERRGTVRGAGV